MYQTFNTKPRGAGKAGNAGNAEDHDYANALHAYVHYSIIIRN